MFAWIDAQISNHVEPDVRQQSNLENTKLESRMKNRSTNIKNDNAFVLHTETGSRKSSQVKTVADVIISYTEEQIARAERARKLYHSIGTSLIK